MWPVLNWACGKVGTCWLPWGAACPPWVPLRVSAWCPQLQDITLYPHLLTVHSFEREGSEGLDTVILKALVKGEAGQGWA